MGKVIKRPGSVSPSVDAVITEAVEETIRLRAYELFEERGRGDGHDSDDWLRAEEEIRGNTKLQQAA